MVEPAKAFAAAGIDQEPVNQAPPVRAAILVIDMQNYFLGMIEDGANLAAGIDHVNEIYAGKLPVYLVTSVLGQDFLDPEIAEYSRISVKQLPQANTVEKSASSGFQYGQYGDLHRMLRNDGVTHLYVMGINRSICVAETAIDGRKLGYTVDIVHDLTADGKNILRNKDIDLMTAQRAAEHGIGWISSKDLTAGVNAAPQLAPLIVGSATSPHP